MLKIVAMHNFKYMNKFVDFAELFLLQSY